MQVHLALLALALALPLAAQDLPEGFSEGAIQLDGASYPYLLLSPPPAGPEETYPLVVFLHGAGERGDDNREQLVHFPGRMAAQREQYPCYLLAPQCPEDVWWSDADWAIRGKGSMPPVAEPQLRAAIAAMQEVLAAHPIDRQRIYLTGLSMGGYGSFEFAARHPDWFAAAAPVCGGGDPDVAIRYAGLPLSVWHGAADPIVPCDRSRVLVEAQRALGADPAFHELEGVRHAAWVNAYGEGGVLDWLFAQRRDRARLVTGRAGAFPVAAPEGERVAFLGDSITQAGNGPGGYVDQLRAVWSAADHGIEVIPAGISGHRVPDLLARYERDVLEKGATSVFVYIGINDVWHSKSGRGTPIEAYEAGLLELVGAFQEEGLLVVLATPTVIGEKPPGQNELDAMLDDFAAVSREVAAAKGVELCDLRRAFQDHLAVFNPEGLERGVLTTDGVHLNAAGNALVAAEAARALFDGVSRR